MSQISFITLDREARDGRYADVIDVADELGKGPFGSAANAINELCRESPTFLRVISQLRSRRGPQDAGDRSHDAAGSDAGKPHDRVRQDAGG